MSVDIYTNPYGTTYDIPLCHTNDAVAFNIACHGDECWGCEYDELCWMSYQLTHILMKREVQEHYFTMIYSEGE